MAREVTAKLKIVNVTKSDGQHHLTFHADYNDEGRNKEWAKYTPYANLNMAVTDKVADGFFEQGKAFTVTFTPES